jgi:hypothetical protein
MTSRGQDSGECRLVRGAGRATGCASRALWAVAMRNTVAQGNLQPAPPVGASSGLTSLPEMMRWRSPARVISTR